MARKRFFAKSIEFDSSQLFLGSLVYFLLVLGLLSVVFMSYSTYFPAGIIYLPYILIVPAFLFFVLRRVSMPLWMMLVLFSLVSTFPLLLLLFCPISEVIYLCFCAFILAMISISARYKRTDTVKVGVDQLGTSMFIHGFFLLISGLSDYDGSLKYFLLAHTLLSLCVFFLARQHYIFETTYGHISKSPTQPSAAVRERHNRVIFLLCVFSLLIVPIVVLFPYSILTDLLRDALRLLLKAISLLYDFFKKFNLFPEMEKAVETPVEIAPVEDSSSMSGFILEMILNLIALAVVVVFLYFSIRGVYRFIVTMYRRSSKKTDLSVDGLVIDEVFSIRKKDRRSIRRPDFGEGDEKDIRKKYYRSVRRAIRDGAEIDPSFSPEEIRDAVFNKVGNDFDTLSVQYEKYRYGTGGDSVNISEKDS